MIQACSRALMTLASCCLGESRRPWALAMEAEYDAAREDGKPLAFAAGCLMTAWRGMPGHAEGRFALTNYALALGLLIPIAVLQFGGAVGAFAPFLPLADHHGLLTAVRTPNAYAASAQLSSVPILVILWILLGIAQLRLAWLLVDRDWPRIINVMALIAAATITLIIFMNLLLLDATPLIPHIAALGIELAAIMATARWHDRLFSDATTDSFA